MDTRRSERYKAALHELNLREVARETGRGYSTLQAYLAGTRRVTDGAVRELVAFLRERAERYNSTADALEALTESENDGPTP